MQAIDLFNLNREFVDYLAFRTLKDNLSKFDFSYLNDCINTFNIKRAEKLPLLSKSDLEKKAYLALENIFIFPVGGTSHWAIEEEIRSGFYSFNPDNAKICLSYFLVNHIKGHWESSVVCDSTLILDKEQTKAFVQDYKYNPNYEKFWPFIASKLRGPALEAFFDLLEQEPRDLIGIYHQILMMRCLYDARSDLSSARIEKIEKELLAWLNWEIRRTDNSHFGKDPLFPEHLLIQALKDISREDNAQNAKRKLINAMRARPSLSPEALEALCFYE